MRLETVTTSGANESDWIADPTGRRAWFPYRSRRALSDARWGLSGLDCIRTQEFLWNSAFGKEFDMKSSSWIVVMFAVAVTASLVAAKSLLSVTERSQAAVPTQTRSQFIPIAQSTKPVLVGHRQPAAPASWAKARPTAEVELGPPSLNADGTWTVLVVHGDKREYITYNSMRRITQVN